MQMQAASFLASARSSSVTGAERIDHLTKLGTRRALDLELSDCIARRSGGLALAALGVNRLKDVNEALGHRCGDQTLRVLAQRLLKWKPPFASTKWYRLAGDVFIMLLEVPKHQGDAVDEEQLQETLEELLFDLGAPIRLEGHELALTLTAGVAVSQDLGDIRELLLRANLAREHARECGVAVGFHQPALSRESAQVDLKVGADIRRAVEQREFVLHYQPKVCPRSGALTGLEALIRWEDPRTGAQIPPSRFIPYLETVTSHIHTVTQWVLEQALADLADLPQHPDLCMAVNISAKNLLDERFVDKVVRVLKTHGIEPHRLELELTESSFLTRPHVARRRIERLAGLGVKVSIDDFGTGFSSLSYLQTLPVHAIKVDQSFVRPMESAAKSATIVRLAAQLAHGLGMKAIAEGVETEEMVEVLA